MKIRFSSLSVLASASVLALVSACSSAPPANPVAEAPGVANTPATFSQLGYVRSIDTVNVQGKSNHVGAVLGAVIGAVAGNQIGDGNGQKAAIAAGAVGGAVVGNAVQNRNLRDDEVFRVTVRFDDGHENSYDFQRVDALRVGDRVKYVDGQLYRV